jgi:hypothetical protein
MSFTPSQLIIKEFIFEICDESFMTIKSAKLEYVLTARAKDVHERLDLHSMIHFEPHKKISQI